MSILKRGALASTPPLLGWKKERNRMSATISTVKEAIGGLYSKQSILAAIERAFGNGDEAEFTISVDGQESIIIREAMRRYCAPPSKAEEILAAITPEGCELLPGLIHAPDDPTACISLHPDLHVRVKIRRIAPPVEYEYIAEAEPRIARSGDWVREGWQWKLVKADEHPYGGPQLCYRRVEVKR